MLTKRCNIVYLYQRRRSLPEPLLFLQREEWTWRQPDFMKPLFSRK